MSEVVSPTRRKRPRLTTGHHKIDLWAGFSPVALAAISFIAAWHYQTFSGVGLFLNSVGFVLALLGVAIIGLRVHVPNHRDYYGGLMLILLGLVAFWSGSDLAAMRGFSFGAGTAPRLFACALILVAVVITASGLVTKADAVGNYAVRGPVFITLAVIAFALLIRGFTLELGGTVFKFPAFGLIIASFACFVVSAAGSKETRWIESIPTAAALTAFCWLLFVYLLGLPFQLWPRFW